MYSFPVSCTRLVEYSYIPSPFSPQNRGLPLSAFFSSNFILFFIMPSFSEFYNTKEEYILSEVDSPLLLSSLE